MKRVMPTATELEELARQLKQQLGSTFLHRRRQVGLTQRDVADLSGLSLKYLGEVERGEANVTVDTLAKVAWVLDWDPWALFGDQQPAMAQNTHELLTADLDRARRQLVSLSDWIAALSPLAQRSSADENGAAAGHGGAAATRADRRRGPRQMRHVVRRPRLPKPS